MNDDEIDLERGDVAGLPSDPWLDMGIEERAAYRRTYD